MQNKLQITVILENLAMMVKLKRDQIQTRFGGFVKIR